MTIALLLHKYFPYGGLQRDCLRMAILMARRGHRVSIVTRTWSGDVPDEVEVVCLGARGWTNLAKDRNFDHDVAGWLSTRSFDRVVGFSRLATNTDYYYAADPCYIERVRHTKPAIHRLGSRYRYMAALEEKIFAHGGDTKVLLLTETERADYIRHYRTEAERLVVLPPSITHRGLEMPGKKDLRSRTREQMGWPSELPVVLFVGSGFATKGLDRAIHAIASSRDQSRLVIAGSGESGRYQKLANRLGAHDRVDFLGARDDAWELMAAADILIHPARSENTGTVLVEALSAGTAVIATDRCGFSNHVRASGTGQVLDSPFDQGALDEGLGAILAEPWEPRAEMALAYALTEDLYSGMETAITEILSEPGNGPGT